MGSSLSVYAEQLGGSDVISANVYRTGAGDVLKPCEMPAAKVLDFLRAADVVTDSTGRRQGVAEIASIVRVSSAVCAVG